MASTFFGLNIGGRGLYAYKSALETTAHNIANIETRGYSRQVLNTQAAKALKMNSRFGMAGTGVDVTGVEQMRNKYYDMKYWKNNTLYGEYETKNNYMSQIQSYFNELNLEGFTTSFNSMHDSLQELMKDPSSLTTRTQMTNFASSLTEYFNFLSESMESIQEENNFEVKNQVDKINSLAQQLATLNKQINTLEVGGITANDLRDERAVLIDELSLIADVSVTENVVGAGVGVNSFIVKINGQTLVDTTEYNSLVLVPRDEKVNLNDIKGLYDITWQDGQKFDPVGSARTGTLKALFELRDGNDGANLQGTAGAGIGEKQITLTDSNINHPSMLNIPPTGVITVGNKEYAYDGFTAERVDGKMTYVFNLADGVEVREEITAELASIGDSITYKGIPHYMAQLNEFVRTYSNAFNTVHKGGQDLEGREGLDFFNGKHPVSGDNYIFGDENTIIGAGSMEDPDISNENSYYFLRAKNFSVTKEIVDDPRRIVTATDITNGIEESDIAMKLLQLKTDKNMFKQGKPSDFLQTIIVEVGIDAKKAENFSKSQDNIIRAIENQRLSVSGVDIDEETLNLVRFQNAYNLSAQVISVMDEIYDKLINQMGV